MKGVWIGLSVLCFFLSTSLLTKPLSETPFDRKMKEAHRLMFQTYRKNEQLQKALDIYEELYKEQKDPSKTPASLILEYAYALYYKAGYTYPEEGEKGYKEALPEMTQLYKTANDLLDSLLDNEDRLDNESQKVTLYFISGMIKGELASINSSPFLIIRGRKLLEKALKEDRTYQRGGIYLGLGRMYSRTPRILFGSKSKSLEFLAHALKDFNPPSLVGFYFEMETILDDGDFKKLLFVERQSILQSAADALMWEKKRRRLPPTSKDFITPEEDNAMAMIRRYLQTWGYSTDLPVLQKQIAQLKN